MVIFASIKRAIVIWRNHLHSIKKFNRFGKRNSSLSLHCSPCFVPKAGDLASVGQCRPFS